MVLMKHLKYIFLLGLLFLLLNTDCYAMTFEEYLNYLGTQNLTGNQQTAYDYFYQTYYNSTVDFTDLLTSWESTDTIYTLAFTHTNSSPFNFNVVFINLNNNFMYKDGNTLRFSTSLSCKNVSYRMSNDKTKIEVASNSTSNRSFYNVGSDFFQTNATSPRFIISKQPMYTDNSATMEYSGFYWFNEKYSDVGFNYVDNPIYTNYINQNIKLGEFIGGVDYSNVTIQFGFLNQDNTMGQVIAQYGYVDSSLPSLYINNNNLYIDSRLITSDNYAVSVVIDTISYDKVLDIQFINTSGSGNAIFDIQDGTNNIINNNNNNKNDIINNQNENTDKIISAITNPFNPNSGDYLLSSGDILAGFDYENGYINFFNTLLNILRDVFINRNQRSVNLGELPILNSDFVLDLDGNLKCPYPPMLVDFIQIFSNGAIVFFIFKFGYRLYELFVTGDIDNLLLSLETSSYSFIHWF